MDPTFNLSDLADERVRRLADSVPEMLWMSDAQGQGIFFNKKWLEFGRRRIEDELGKGWMKGVHPEDSAEVSRQYFAAMSECREFSLQFRLRRHDGVYRQMLNRGAPVFSGSACSGYVGSCLDVTEQREIESDLQRTKQELEFILDVTKTGVDIIDSDFRLRYVDPGWKKVYGEFEGKKCYEYFMKRTSVCPTCGIPRALETKQVVVSEEVLPLENNRPVEVHSIPFQANDGKWCVAEFNVDITARKKAEETFRLTQFSVDRAGVSIFWVDPDGSFLYANDMACQVLGYTREELLSMSVPDIDPNLPKTAWRNHWENLKKNRILRFESVHRTKDGRIFPVELAVNYFEFEGREYNCAFARDISERKRAEEALRESEHTKTSLLKAAPIGIGYVFDRIIGWTNSQLPQITGYSNEELMGMCSRQLYLSEEEFERVGRVKYSEIERHGVGHVETRWRRKNGEVIDILLSSAAIDPMRPERGYVFTVLDISERKRSMGEIAKSLKEKEILLQELHHRVKNNLQVIASLLNLQSRHVKDKTVLQKLTENQNRIQSIVFLHEKLFQTSALAKINFYEYSFTLVSHVLRSYGISGERIQVAFQIDDQVILDVDRAISCGLIVNELVSNSIKHAFRPKEKGKIVIELKRSDDDLVLSVSDNGRGMPKKFDLNTAKTLGLQLVGSLAREQLRGKLQSDLGLGTKISVSFPKE